MKSHKYRIFYNPLNKNQNNPPYNKMYDPLLRNRPGQKPRKTGHSAEMQTAKHPDHKYDIQNRII